MVRYFQAQVGGGEGIEGIYGSIGMSGMCRIFSVLISKCGLDSSSAFLDVGTGLGRYGLILKGINKLNDTKLLYVTYSDVIMQYNLTIITFYRPLLHAVYNAGIASSFGIEIDETKVQKALAFIKRTIDEMGSEVSTPILYCISIENVSF